MFKVLFTKQKKAPVETKEGQRRKAFVYLGFHGSFVFVVSPVTHGLSDRALGSYSR